MKTRSNIYDFLLKSFTSKDDIRPALCTPGEIDGLVYATDANTAIRFKKELANFDYSTNTTFPSADKVYEKEDGDFTITTLKAQELLLSVFDCETDYEKKTEPCKKCKGKGYKKCKECNHEEDCQKCDGQGGKEVDAQYAKQTINGDDVELLAKVIAPKFLYRVLNVALLLQETTIEVYTRPDLHKMFFKIGDCEILVMAKYIVKP